MANRLKMIFVATIVILSFGHFVSADEIGKFVSLEGNVDIVKTGAAEAVPATVGKTVAPGDIIRTKSQSKAELKFDDATTLKIAESSRVEIKEYGIENGKRRDATISLERGSIRVVVAKSAGNNDFKIITPNASGSVKGTDLFVSYLKSATSILVVNGKFSVANPASPDKVIVVTSGNTTLISADEPPQSPRVYLALEKNRYETETAVTPQKIEAASRKESGTKAAAEGYSEAGEMKAKVTSVSGSVRVRNRGSIVWHDAKLNEILGAGDTIETKDDGKIEIKIDNNNIINLKPNSQLTLQKLTEDPKSGDYENLLESNHGKIRAKVGKIKGNSKFEIKTPTAVAAVRGTIMYLNILPGLMSAYFEEGNGLVTNVISGVSKIVAAGNSSNSDSNGNVSNPTPPSDSERSEWQEGWNTEGGGEGYSPPTGEQTGDTGETTGGSDLNAGGGLNPAFSELPITEIDSSLTNSANPDTDTTTESTTETIIDGASPLTGTASGESSAFSATLTAQDTLAQWPYPSAPAILTGTYSNPTTPWLVDITGSDVNGGTFDGWMGGTWHSWEGVVSSLYIDSSGKAGNLFGYMSGDEPVNSNFSGNGDLFVIPLTQVSIPGPITYITTPESISLQLYLDGDIYFDPRAYDSETRRMDGQNWGVWKELYDADYYNGSGNSNWTEVAGGWYDEGYYLTTLEGIDNIGTSNSLRVDMTETRLDYTTFGAYWGTILGTGTGDGEGGSYLTAIGLGGFAEKPLTSSGEIYAYLNSYDESWTGDLDGLIGTVGETWNNQPSNLVSMGNYYNYSDSEPFTWIGTFYSYDPYNETYTTYSDSNNSGAFYGITTGIGTNSILKGLAEALYIDPAGNAGILSGDLSGAYSNDIEMYLMQGLLSKTQMATALDLGGDGISPAELYNSVWDGGGDGTLNGRFSGGGSIEGYENLRTASIVNYEAGIAQNWGIYSQDLYGSFSDRGLDTNFTARIGGNDSFGAYNPAAIYYGDYNLDDGRYYYYQYYSDNKWGYQQTYTPTQTTYEYRYISYYADGTTYSYGYAYDYNWNFLGYLDPGTSGTWTTSVPLSELIGTPPAGTIISSYLNHYVTADNDYGYWIAEVKGDGNNEIGAALNGRFLTYTKMGTMAGDILGNYTITGSNYDEETGNWISDYGNWQAIGAGKWEGAPLALSGEWGYGGGSLYYNDDGYVSWAGEDYGLIGSAAPDWWDQQSFPFLAMGEYYEEGYSEPYIFNTPVNSYNIIRDDSTTLDGGAFWGYTGGIWNNGVMDGAVAALYVDPSGNAGVLRGDLSGNYYSDLGMWAAEGALTPTRMATDIGLSPQDLQSYVSSGYLDANVEGYLDNDGYISGWSDWGNTYFINQDGNSQSWGIYDLKLGDENYYYNPEGSKLWMATIGGYGQFGYNDSQGLMKGDVYGVYDGPYSEEGYGSWIATSVGVWNSKNDDSAETYSDGQYYGYIGGLWNNNTIIGGMAAIYVQPYPDVDIAEYASWDPVTGQGVGNFNGTGNIARFDLGGNSLGLPEESWGIYYLQLGGSYNNPQGQADWTSVMGGSDINYEGKSYWLVHTSGAWQDNMIRGNTGGNSLSDETLGTIEGKVFGLYNETEPGNGTWDAISLGSWSEEPLAFSGELSNGGFGQYDTIDQEVDFNTNNISALLGGTESLWEGSPAKITLIGEFSNPGYKLWGVDIEGYTADDAVFIGATGGTDVNNSLEGKLIALYIRPDGDGYQAGYIKSIDSINGGFYPEIGMFEAYGELIAYDMGTTLYTPQDLFDGTEYYPWDESTAFRESEFGGVVNGDIYGTISGDSLGIRGQDWDIWRLGCGGTFTDSSSDWKAVVSGLDVYEDEGRGLWIGIVTGDAWSNDKLSGTVAGVSLDYERSRGFELGTFNGDLIGIYEGDTWQALGLGSSNQIANLGAGSITDANVAGNGLGKIDGELMAGLFLGESINSTPDTGTFSGILAGTGNIGENSEWQLALGVRSYDETGDVNGYLLGTADSSSGFRGVTFGPNTGEGTFTVGKAEGTISDITNYVTNVDTTWSATATGEWVDLSELSTDALDFNQVALAEMVSVPITETYSSLLTGSGTLGATGTINAQMDISFYAQAATDLSGIWAALFSGSYTNPGGATTGSVALTDNAGTSANLTNLQWNNNTWVGNVSGTAPQSTTFTGQAGGTYTGTDSGTLQGVGAGTWQQTPPTP